MFKIDYISPEIEEACNKEDGKLHLVANIPQPVKVFQGERKIIKTGVAIKTDQHVFAMPTKKNTLDGLVLGAGFDIVSDQEGEIELIVWNRNAPGQQRMIEVMPGMQLAKLIISNSYIMKKAAPKKKADKPAEKPEDAKQAS